MNKASKFIATVLPVVLLPTGCSKSIDKSSPAASNSPSRPASVAAAAPPASGSPSSTANVSPTCDFQAPHNCEQKCLDGDRMSCGPADALLRKGADDPQLRLKLNDKGCQLRDMKSCNRLGIQYDKGDGVARDSRKGLEYHMKACDGGNPNGCLLAGDYYGDCATKRPQDISKARESFQKGCELRDKPNCEQMKMTDDGRWPRTLSFAQLLSAASKFLDKRVCLHNVAVQRLSPTSGQVFEPGTSPSVDGVNMVLVDDPDEGTRTRWMALPSGAKALRGNATAGYIIANVEQQAARDVRIRLVVETIGNLKE